MRSFISLPVIATTITLFGSSLATFSATAKTNVVTYWGQGPNQARLLTTCQDPNIDIINVAFVNVFPDQGAGGYPGTNFGNACGSTYYKNKAGVTTQLLNSCPNIGPDITACQTTYGKKIMLSLGGGYPTNQYLVSNTSAVNFAAFLWGAFGPVNSTWNTLGNPRPFGTAVVDGFDFDIESSISPAPKYNGATVTDYQTRGYAKMIETLRTYYAKVTTKSFYISAAPQCSVPDAHFGSLVTKVWFDWMFVQFYNTPACSARTGINYLAGKSKTDMTFTQWNAISYFNKNARVYIGLPGSTAASNNATNYLSPQEVLTLVKTYYKDSRFGGVMIYEATYAAKNVICSKNYFLWTKRILIDIAAGQSITITTSPCATAPKTTTGTCGANYGTTCRGYKGGQCCNSANTCGNTAADCSSCNSSFSNCTYAATLSKRELENVFADRDASVRLASESPVPSAVYGGPYNNMTTTTTIIPFTVAGNNAAGSSTTTSSVISSVTITSSASTSASSSTSTTATTTSDVTITVYQTLYYTITELLTTKTRTSLVPIATATFGSNGQYAGSGSNEVTVTDTVTETDYITVTVAPSVISVGGSGDATATVGPDSTSTTYLTQTHTITTTTTVSMSTSSLPAVSTNANVAGHYAPSNGTYAIPTSAWSGALPTPTILARGFKHNVEHLASRSATNSGSKLDIDGVAIVSLIGVMIGAFLVL